MNFAHGMRCNCTATTQDNAAKSTMPSPNTMSLQCTLLHDMGMQQPCAWQLLSTASSQLLCNASALLHQCCSCNMYINCHVQLDASATAAAAAARLILHMWNPTANTTRWMQTLQCAIPTTLMVSQQLLRADTTNKFNSKQPAIQGQSICKVPHIATQLRLVAYTYTAVSNSVYKTDGV